MMTREQQHDRIKELEKSLNQLKNNLDHCQQSDQVNRDFEDFERLRASQHREGYSNLSSKRNFPKKRSGFKK